VNKSTEYSKSKRVFPTFYNLKPLSYPPNLH
jgi:hypothetical protein